ARAGLDHCPVEPRRLPGAFQVTPAARARSSVLVIREVAQRFLPYGRQLIEDDDVAAVVRVLRSDFLTTGPETEAFEAELAADCGAAHAVVVANGTAALHCAYAAAGVTAGSEVVTTPLTFSSTANTVLA